MCLLLLNFPHVHANLCIELPGRSYDIVYTKVAHTLRHPKRDTILLFLSNDQKIKQKPNEEQAWRKTGKWKSRNKKYF